MDEREYEAMPRFSILFRMTHALNSTTKRVSGLSTLSCFQTMLTSIVKGVQLDVGISKVKVSIACYIRSFVHV